MDSPRWWLYTTRLVPGLAALISTWNPAHPEANIIASDLPLIFDQWELGPRVARYLRRDPDRRLRHSLDSSLAP